MTEYFNVLVVDLDTGRSRAQQIDGRNEVAGGSGLAALLFSQFGKADQDWDHPAQPFILAIGPLTGYFPADEQNGLRLRFAISWTVHRKPCRWSFGTGTLFRRL